MRDVDHIGADDAYHRAMRDRPPVRVRDCAIACIIAVLVVAILTGLVAVSYGLAELGSSGMLDGK